MIDLSGIVRDQSTGERLSYAMVVLSTVSETKQSAYMQTDSSGRFSFSVRADVACTVEVYYLGYERLAKSFGPLGRDTLVELGLRPVAANLDEVIVKDTLPPITRRGDTVTYNAKLFYTGRERKLNELVDNLPGLAIDDNNEITYQGKQVSSVLVEGKPFFGGNSELALTGLPANAVGKVQVLEKYSPLGFSLGLEEEKIALNVILRSEKKNIFFGELEAGAGPPANYATRTDLFSYQDSRNVYLLGGSNNTNTVLLSPEQGMQLLRGTIGFADENFLDRYREIANFQNRPHGIANHANLIALGGDFPVSPRTDLHAYGVFTDWRTRFMDRTTRIFDTNPGSNFTESEQNSGIQDRVVGMMRLDGKTMLDERRVLSVNLRVSRFSQAERLQQTYRASGGRNRDSESDAMDRSFEGEAVAEYISKSDQGHVHQLGLSFSLRSQFEDLWLQSDVPFLITALPWSSEEKEYVLKQETNLPHSAWSLRDRYQHRFGPRLNLTNQFKVETVNSSLSVAQTVATLDTLTGIDRRMVSDKLILALTPGDWKIISSLEARFQHWKWAMHSTDLFSILPGLQIERSIAGVGVFSAEYQRTIDSPEQRWFFPSTYLENFVALRSGNPNLQPLPSSRIGFNFQRSNPFTFSSWSVAAFHAFTEGRSIVNTLLIAENERFFSYSFLNESQATTSVNVSLNKEFPKSDLRIFIVGLRSNQYTLTGSSLRAIENVHQVFFLRGNYRKYLGDNSDLRLKAKLSRADFIRGEQLTTNYNLSGSLTGGFAFKSLTFFPELEVEAFQITEDPLVFIRCAGVLQYRKIRSPWAWKLQGSAPVSGKTILSVSQNDLFYRENRISVFPSYLLASIAYDF